MRFYILTIPALLVIFLATETAMGADDEITIFNDPKWFPVHEQTVSFLYEYDGLGYTNKSLVMQSDANDKNTYSGGSLDYMEFSTGRDQFALYGHVGYRPKWKLAPYIQGGVDLYSTLVELLSGNGLKLNSRISSGLQWTFKESHIRVFYRISSLDFTHFTTENGTYTTYGISFATVVGRSKKWRKNPPVVAFNSGPYGNY